MFIESFEDALERRRIHRSKLRLGTKRQRRVARALSKCRRQSRCGTEACRVCLREFRLLWLGEAAKIMVQKPHWTRCSIIPAGLQVPYGALSTFDINSEIKCLRKRIQRSALSGRIVLGALDVSLNLENNTIQGWQWHVYLIVEGENDQAFGKRSRALSRQIPRYWRPMIFSKSIIPNI
jgi:hypothetical protein